MFQIIKQQKMTLAVVASFGLAIAGISTLGDNQEQDTGTSGTLTTKVIRNKVTASANIYGSSTETTKNRRAPEIVREHISGRASGKVNRTLVRNKISGNEEDARKEEIIKTLRDNHLASVEERAKEASEAQAAENTIAATEGAETKPEEGKQDATAQQQSLSAAAGAVKTTAPENTGDYRRKMLREAVLEVLKTPEPWKELVAIGLAQANINDHKGARETLDLAKRLLPVNTDEPNVLYSAQVSITQALAKIGELDKALDMASTILPEQFRNQAVSSVISEQINKQQFSAAKTLVTSLSIPEYREASLRNIAEGEARVGRDDPAITTVSLISNLSMRDDALKRVAVTQARAKQWDTALSTAQLISNTDINEQAKAEIIALQIDTGDLASSRNHINGIKKDAIRDDLNGRLARKQASQGNLVNSMTTSELILNPLVRENTLASVAVQQARHGDTSGAFHKASTLVNQNAKTQGLRDVTMVEASLKGMTSAYNMVSQIENPTSRDATLRAMAQREAGAGNLSEAVNCAQSIMASDCRVLTLAETALSCIKSAPSRQAVSVLEDTTSMITALPENNGNRTEAIVKVANAYALINRLDETIGNIVRIPSEGRRDSALEQIAYDCVDKNRLEDAQNLANRIANAKRRKSTLENIALRHARNVDPAHAKKELQRFDTNEQRSQFLRGMASKG